MYDKELSSNKALEEQFQLAEICSKELCCHDLRGKDNFYDGIL